MVWGLVMTPRTVCDLKLNNCLFLTLHLIFLDCRCPWELKPWQVKLWIRGDEQGFYKLWERRGRSTRKRLTLRRGKIFGRKVGTEISCCGLSSGREGGTVFEKLALQNLVTWAEILGCYPEVQESEGFRAAERQKQSS